MPRSFWSGTLSFGLVEIPVRLHSAEQSRELSFKLLDRKDLSPIGYRRFNKNTDEEVPWDRIVKGYEYEDDRYVVLTDEDFARANVEATQTIEILAFVDRTAIPPVFFESPYFIEPSKRASKAYVLLREALSRSGRIGIGRVVLRTRAHLVAVVVWKGALVLEVMRYGYELRDPGQLEIPAEGSRSARISAPELRMAERLIEDMVEPEWDPARYHDEYRDDLLALIEKKIKSGKTHVIDESKPAAARKRPSEVMDLMPLLEKSLAARGRSRPADAAHRGPERRTRRTRERGGSRGAGAAHGGGGPATSRRRRSGSA
jgi:DNA end-binding protein Ku